MSDIFRDLTIKQKKYILPPPPHYRTQVGISGGWLREEHIGDIMVRVIVGICDRSTQYHMNKLKKENMNED